MSNSDWEMRGCGSVTGKQGGAMGDLGLEIDMWQKKKTRGVVVFVLRVLASVECNWTGYAGI